MNSLSSKVKRLEEEVHNLRVQLAEMQVRAEGDPATKMLSITDVASRLGLSTRKVRQMQDGGAIHMTKVAGTWRISEKQLAQDIARL